MNTILKECITAFTEARGKIIDALESLWRVSTEEAWKGEYDSFSDFCEEGLKISKSTGSQYIAIYDRYVHTGGLTVKQLREVDPVKLYKALKLKGDPKQQYATALTWRREDFKENDRDECEHLKPPVNVCPDCWKKMD